MRRGPRVLESFQGEARAFADLRQRRWAVPSEDMSHMTRSYTAHLLVGGVSGMGRAAC